MSKTKEEKAQYCREWRIKNRESYLTKKRALYHKNKEGYREEAKERAKKYYYNVMRDKRNTNREYYRGLDKIASDKKLEKRRALIRGLREGLGGKCICGFAEIDLLQFHHTHKNKLGNVCEIQSMKKMVEEAKKCILLCPNCHARETLNNHRNND